MCLEQRIVWDEVVWQARDRSHRTMNVRIRGFNIFLHIMISSLGMTWSDLNVAKCSWSPWKMSGLSVHLLFSFSIYKWRPDIGLQTLQKGEKWNKIQGSAAPFCKPLLISPPFISAQKYHCLLNIYHTGLVLSVNRTAWLLLSLECKCMEALCPQP